MYRIKIFLSSEGMERYLNKYAKKGYVLQSMIPMALFVPLDIQILQFIKAPHKNRIYQLISKESEQWQQLKEEEWYKFVSHNNTNYDIIYKDTQNRNDVFKEDISQQKHQNLAALGLKEGLFLLIIYGFMTIFYPSASYNQSVIGFLLHHSYLIIALIMVIVSGWIYIRNK